MAGKELRIGLVGYGFMGRAHSNAFRTAGNFFDLGRTPVLTAVCGRTRDQAEAHAAQWGFQSVETDWEKLVARDDIDMIDITVPNDMHKDIAIAAAEAGKMVMCEKPLGRNAARIGEVVADHPGSVRLKSRIGGERIVDLMSGEQLPRIC